MALYGVYGRHEIKDCPLNNAESRKFVAEIAKTDMSSVLPKYKINKVVGQFHSGLEHTFLWIFDAEDPHLLQQFAIEGPSGKRGVASFNEIKIVPLMTFDDVVRETGKIDQN